MNLSPEPVGDFLLNSIPRIKWMGYVADAILLLVTALLVFAYRNNKSRIPFLIYSVGSILFARSVLILLTPAGNSFGNTEYWDLFSFGHLPSGMFPSGHTAYVFLSYLWLRSFGKKYLVISHALFIAEIAALIVSHGHYSIDIIGGMMLAYITYRLGEDYLKREKK